MDLRIECLPKNAWGKNLRTILRPSHWDRLRKATYKQYDNKCCICGDDTHTIEAHELWEFNLETKVQKLTNVVAVCQPCHGVIHFGRSQLVGYGDAAKAHLMRINFWDEIQADIHILEAISGFHKLNNVDKWELDLSFATDQGYELR